MASPLPRRYRFFPAAILSLAALALFGCPGTLDPSLTGGMGGSGVCDAPTMLFQSVDTTKGCGSDVSCHGATRQESGLDLVSPGVVSRLLGKMPDPTLSESCKSSTEQYLIANTSPAQGLMIDKLNSGNCGSPMPFPLGGLPANLRTCLMDWATAVTTGMITQ